MRAESRTLLTYKPKLLHCPLCGGHPTLWSKRTKEDVRGQVKTYTRYWIVCDDCGAETHMWRVLTALLAYWNTREEDRCQVVFI